MMKYRKFDALAVMAMATIFASSDAAAQTAGFTDDFSASTIPASQYITGNSTITAGSDHLLLSGISDGSKSRSRLRLNGTTDTLATTIALSANTDSQAERRGTLRLLSRFYNDTQDGGFDGNIGDIVSLIGLQPNSDGTTARSIFCLYREIGNDWDQIPVFDGEACTTVSEEMQYETPYDASMAIDRSQKTLTYTLNGTAITVNLPGEVYASASNSHYIEAVTDDGMIEGRVYALSHDNATLALDSLPETLLPYRLWDSGKPGATASVTNGELKLSATSSSEERVRSRVAIDSPIDTMQVNARISSESAIGEGATGRARVASSLYNTLADGGIDNRLGEVFATTQMQLRDGSIIIEACAWEATDPDWATADPLYTTTADGECEVLVSDASFDTNYLLGLSLDRANNKIVHRVNNDVYEHNITTQTYAAASENDMAMRTDVRGAAGTLVAYFDNLVAGNPASDTATDAETDPMLAECVDTVPLGDGWGWNGSTSCTIATITVPQVCVDTPPAGDGWGWDGSSSCRIDVAEDMQNDSNAPVCYDTAPVGDGWGWDGSASCQVTSSEPVCFDSAPVGDGWGWNGSTSCRIASTDCIDSPPVGDGWGWDGQQSCRL
jgi:hypothetical protein